MRFENTAANLKSFTRDVSRTICILCFLLAGCSGNRSYDAYMEALTAKGKLKKGACQWRVSADKQSYAVNSKQVGLCLGDVRNVVALLEKAKLEGYKGEDLDRILTEMKEDEERLRKMESNLRRMENDRDFASPQN